MFTRRDFIKLTGSALVGSTLLSICREKHSDIDPSININNILKDLIIKYVNSVHKELGLDNANQEIKVLTVQEAKNRYFELFKIIKNFQEVFEPNNNIDISNLTLAHDSVQKYLVSKGMFLSTFMLGSDQVGATVFPLIRIYEIQPYTEATGYSIEDCDIYKITSEFSSKVLAKNLPTFTAATTTFNDLSAIIVVNPLQIAVDINQYKESGVVVDEQDYFASLVKNELGNLKFNRRYEYIDPNIEIKFNIRNGATFSATKLQLSEAYSDLCSFEANSSFPGHILRILLSVNDGYKVSQRLLQASILKFNQTYRSEKSLDPRLPQIIAARIYQDPKLNEELLKIVKHTFSHFFENLIFPKLDSNKI